MKKILLILVVSLVACKADYTGKYDITDGVPKVHYVRWPDPALGDELLTSASLNQTICIVGDNLTSVRELYFNDRKAILNVNLITEHTLIVTIPRERANEITNKIYFINKSGQSSDFDFTVNLPVPAIARIVCENVAAGKDVVVEGNYFYDDDPEARPIEVRVGTYSVPAADITVISPNRLKFKAPPAGVSGQVQVKSIFGTGAKSAQIFRDLRGLITNFDDGFTGGWDRPKPDMLGNDPALALDGKYAVMDAALGGGAWNGGTIINIWASANAFMSDPLFSSDPATSVLKFEINVTSPWMGLPLTAWFAPTGSNEDCLWADGTAEGGGFPRGFWAPWVATGSYVSEFGWETVSIPLADMKYNGANVDVGTSTAFGQLTISTHNRGAEIYGGVASSPVILLDNVRVVSVE